MGCPKLEYNLSSEPRLRCMYNAADGENEDGLVKPTQLGGSAGKRNGIVRKTILDFLKI